MKKTIFLLSGILFLSVPSASAAEEAMAAPSMAPDQLTKQDIRAQVKTLRQERVEQMPYLDRSYIRADINEDSVRQKIQFAANSGGSLEDLIVRAVETHTPAKAAKERIVLARRRIMVAMRQLFPEMNAKFQHRDGTISSTPFNSTNYRFVFRQPVFRGGILWNRLLQERAGLETAEKEFDRVLGDLVKDLSEAYFEYQRTLATVNKRKAVLEKTSQQVEYSEQKWQQQITSEIEHLNAQSLAGQMKFDYESALQEMELAKLELQRFLGLESDAPLEIQKIYELETLISREEENSGPADAQKISEVEQAKIPSLDELVDLAYQNRPELQVESSKLQSARLEEKIRWGEFIPHADVQLEFGKLGEAFDAVSLDPKLRKEFRLVVEMNWNMVGNNVNYTFENDSRAPSVSSFDNFGARSATTRNSVSMGFLDGLKAFADTKQAEVERLDQIVQLENAEKQVVRDVKQAYYGYQRAVIQVKSSLQRVRYRNKLVSLALHRLGKNEIQISEYLQAEMDLLREEADAHTALKDYFTSKAEINRAVGIRDFLPIEETYGQ